MGQSSGPAPSPDRDVELAFFNAAVALRTTESQVYWGRYNVVVALNAVVLGVAGLLVAGLVDGGDAGVPMVAISCLGLVVCWVWWRMAKAGQAFLDFWAREVERLQRPELKNPMSEYSQFRSERRRSGAMRSESLNRISSQLILLFAGAYGVLALYGLLRAVGPA